MLCIVIEVVAATTPSRKLFVAPTGITAVVIAVVGRASVTIPVVCVPVCVV